MPNTKPIQTISSSKIPQLSANQQKQIDDYISLKSKHLQYPLYSSFDLRISQCKTSIIDCNLFPAGFNNLCENMTESAAGKFQEYLSAYYPKAKNVTIYTEAHTRNVFYYKNIKALGEIVKKAGYECFFAHPEIDGIIEGLIFHKNNLLIADLIISNNDFSNGYPSELEQLQVPVIPRKNLSWFTRRKSKHFRLTNELGVELAKIIDIDPWLFTSKFNYETNVDLQNKDSLLSIKNKALNLFEEISHKYQEYKIETPPTIFIKDDAGTYGMGIMTIQKASDLDSINRKTYNKMSTGKQHAITDLILQEGVPSNLLYNNATAEPVLYCVENHLIGGFLRINQDRGQLANLNSKGMEFYRLCRHPNEHPHLPEECIEGEFLNNFNLLTLRLSLLAAAIENSA